MYLLGIQYTDDDLLGVDLLDYYITFKYGDLTQDLDGAIFLRENATGDQLRSAPYERESDQGIVFGVGFLWRLSERIGVDVGFQRILRIDRPAGAPEGTLEMWQTAAIRAGIIFGLPEKN